MLRGCQDVPSSHAERALYETVVDIGDHSAATTDSDKTWGRLIYRLCGYVDWTRAFTWIPGRRCYPKWRGSRARPAADLPSAINKVGEAVNAGRQDARYAAFAGPRQQGL